MLNEKYNSESQTTINQGRVTIKVELADQKAIVDEIKTCRVCLKEGAFHFPIFGEGVEDLSAYLSNFGGIIVRRNDVYPKYLCQACHGTLYSALIFRKTAQRSDTLLRKTNKHNNCVNIKNETNDAKKPGTNLNVKQELKKKTCNNTKIIKKPDIEQNIKIKSSNTASEIDTKSDTKLNVKQELEIVFETSNHGSNDEEDNGNNTDVEFVIKSQRNVNKKACRCDKCNLDFDTVKDYLKHRSTDKHKKQRKPKSTCLICKKSFCQSNIEQHYKIHDKPLFICDVCGKSYTKRTQLNNHHVIHSFDLQFKCSLCPYKGRFKQCLDLHMLIHTGEKPFACPDCPSKFSHRSNLNKHLRSHRGIRDFKCDQCTRAFYTKPELERHFKADHLGINDFECETCGKSFGTRQRLMKHQLKVHKREKRRIGRKPLYLIAEEIEKTA